MHEEVDIEAMRAMNARRMNEIVRDDNVLQQLMLYCAKQRKLDTFDQYEATKKECPKLVAITNELMRSVRQLKYKYFPLLNCPPKQDELQVHLFPLDVQNIKFFFF